VRVLIVTVVHTPLDARVHHRQIRALREADVEVTYLAPWRATGTERAAAIDGVRCGDLPRAVGRRRVRALRAARRAIARLGPNHDVIVLHDPELVLAVAGRRHRLPPVVLDVHEDLVASLSDRSWLPGALRPAARWAAATSERWAERHLALLLAEPGYADRFAHEHPVVPNLPWLPSTPEPSGDQRVVHLGRLSVGRGAHELLAVGHQLAARGGPVVELIGPADADVRDTVAAAHAAGDVVWHGFVPNERATTLLSGATAGLALLHDLPNYRRSTPTKVVEYLAAGVPVVATPLPEAAALLERSGGGVTVPFPPGAACVSAVVETVLALAADPERRRRLGEAGRAHVAAEASWDVAAPRFVEHLRTLARGA
jgi:glycosyltransferase involved in cell wall biosynthesis